MAGVWTSGASIVTVSKKRALGPFKNKGTMGAFSTFAVLIILLFLMYFFGSDQPVVP